MSEIAYMDLVEITWRDGVVGHIPAPFFEETDIGKDFVMGIQRMDKIRGEETFTCPKCREKNYYSGYCQGCEETTSSKIVEKQNNHNKRRKDNFLSAVLAGENIPSTIRKVEYMSSVEVEE